MGNSKQDQFHNSQCLQVCIQYYQDECNHYCCYWVAKSCLFATPWTLAQQVPLSVEFPRQEYWSRLPFPSPGDLPDRPIELASPALAGGSLTTEPPGNRAQPWLALKSESNIPHGSSQDRHCRLWRKQCSGIALQENAGACFLKLPAAFIYPYLTAGKPLLPFSLEIQEQQLKSGMVASHPKLLAPSIRRLAFVFCQ